MRAIPFGTFPPPLSDGHAQTEAPEPAVATDLVLDPVTQSALHPAAPRLESDLLADPATPPLASDPATPPLASELETPEPLEERSSHPPVSQHQEEFEAEFKADLEDAQKKSDVPELPPASELESLAPSQECSLHSLACQHQEEFKVEFKAETREPSEACSLQHPLACQLQEELKAKFKAEFEEVHKKLDALLDHIVVNKRRSSTRRHSEVEAEPGPMLRKTTSTFSKQSTGSSTVLGTVLSTPPDATKMKSSVSSQRTSVLDLLQEHSSQEDSSDEDFYLDVVPDGHLRVSESRSTFSSQKRQSVISTFSQKEMERAAMLLRFRRRGLQAFASVWDTLENPESSNCARWLARLSPKFIIVTVFFALLQTLDPPPLPPLLAGIVETSIEGIYLLEFVIRFLACPNQRRFFMSAYNLIDFAAAAPLAVRAALGFALPEGGAGLLHHDIVLVVVPLVRLLKLLRRFEKFHLLLKAFDLVAEALPVLMFILSAMGLFFSMLIYLVEDRKNIPSLASAAWFTIVTMTTVGYGDITPESTAGSIITSALVVVTVIYMAIPLGIVGNAFTQTWNERDRLLLMQRTRDRLEQWGYSAHHIPELFRLCDSDDDGELNITEFREMLNCMHIGFTEERIFQLFDSFDGDRRGTVDHKKFVRALFPNSYHEIYGASGPQAGGVELASLSRPRP